MHEIKKGLERLDPPLPPDVSIEIYCSGVHKPGRDGRWIHAFGIVFNLSNGQKAKTTCWVSDDHETTNDRAELGAVITAFEWLELNAKPSNPITILSAEKYIYDHVPTSIRKWIASRKAKNLDLLDLISPHFEIWPHVKWQRAKLGPHPALHEEARKAANIAIDRRISTPKTVGDDLASLDDDFATVDDEFWLKRAMARDRS